MTPLIWLIFGVLQLLTFGFAMFFLCLVMTCLASVNLLGYIRCQKNHRQMMTGFLVSKARENLSAEQMNKVAGMAAEQVIKS